MTTRNFRVHNGISVGDIVIDAATNKITGGSTAAPSADGDFANKKYVDDGLSGLSQNAVSQGDSNVTVTDSGSGSIAIDLDGTDRLTIVAATTTTATGHSIVMGAGSNSAAGSIKFLEGTDNGTNGVTLIGAASTADVTVTLPAAADTLVGKATTDVFTNKTIDANGTGNVITNIDIGNMTAASIVLESEGIAGNDNDITLPTSAAVLDYVTTALGALSSNSITQLNTSVTVTDSGSNGTITIAADGNNELVINDTSATFSGNVVVTGDLNVNGTTTTLATTNTTVADNIMELNSGISASSNDIGFIFERGSTGNNAAILWDESADKFTMGLTTATAGDKSGGISLSGVSTLVANLEGNVTGAVTGNADTATEATNVTVVANNATAETVYLTFVDGATGTQGIETDTGLSYNPSTNVLTTTATQAQYADVAERFEADAPMEIGSVVEVGGSAEITEATSEMSEDVFGVISHKPAYMMNSSAGTDESHPFVAMTGRTPVRVTGAVNKGQRLVTSSIKGCARAVALGESISPFNVIGRALESNTEAGIKLVNCAVRSNN